MRMFSVPSLMPRGRSNRAIAVLSVFFCGISAFAQTQSAAPAQPAEKKTLTREIVLEGKVDFDGSYVSGMRWLPDGTHFLHRRDGELKRVDALTDAAEPAYDAESLAAALRAQCYLDEEAAKSLARNPGAFSEDRQSVLLRQAGKLFLYRFADKQVVRLSDDAATGELLTLSPKAGLVSFVRENNLYTLAIGGAQMQLTRDGNDKKLNAILDWVYEEEVYGRGNRRGHWWRNDDQYIAYLQLDESKVPIYNIADYTPQYSKLEQTNYPKAGEPNPTVRLGIVRAAGGETLWVDLSKYKKMEFLIVRVDWGADGKLFYQVQDREQTWLDLNEADPQTGQSRTLFRETSPAWINVLESPAWLDDGTFLWSSERDGWRHLYHYARDGKLIRRLTSGAWEARDLLGVDQKAGWVYFVGTRDSSIESNAYRVKLAGGPLERLTEPGSNHSVNFDPTFQYFFDTFSNITTPPKVHFRKSDGSLVRVISENEVKELNEYKLSKPELLRIPARDGYMMNAMLLKPPDFDPSRKYPVWSSTYSGPQAPSVHNSWSGGYIQNQLLAQQEYLIWVCDNRSCSGQGVISAWQAYQRLGETELADLEDGLRWLIAQGYADPDRIGLHGWSYGGFMTAYALTHSKMFKLGIAGASPTDWRNYDSIYTERYMRTPQNNPEGYDRTSVVKAAKNLHGKLVLIHGMMDDNVHFQNTVQLIEALQRADRQFDLMIYPRNRHGVWGRHLTDLNWDYVTERL